MKDRLKLIPQFILRAAVYPFDDHVLPQPLFTEPGARLLLDRVPGHQPGGPVQPSGQRSARPESRRFARQQQKHGLGGVLGHGGVSDVPETGRVD